MKYKAVFKPIRQNEFIIEADNLADATQKATVARIEQVKPTSVAIEEYDGSAPKLQEH